MEKLPALVWASAGGRWCSRWIPADPRPDGRQSVERPASRVARAPGRQAQVGHRRCMRGGR